MSIGTRTASASLHCVANTDTTTCDALGANIQLLDLPGIIEGAAKGKGRGRQVIAVARTSDMVLMVLDANNGLKQRELLTAELESVGIRLNKVCWLASTSGHFFGLV